MSQLSGYLSINECYFCLLLGIHVPSVPYATDCTSFGLAKAVRKSTKLANHPDGNELGGHSSASCSTSVTYSALSASASPVSPLSSPFSLGPPVWVKPGSCLSFSSLMY